MAMTVEKALANVDLVGDDDRDDNVAKVKQIKDPTTMVQKKVQNIPTPNLDNTGSKNNSKYIEKVLSSYSAEERKAFAASLVENLKKRKNDIVKDMNDMIKLANRLMDKGLNGEEFEKMSSFLQEDIVHNLMMNGVKADRRDELIKNLSNRYESEEDNGN
jgi:hypothetical protein